MRSTSRRFIGLFPARVVKLGAVVVCGVRMHSRPYTGGKSPCMCASEVTAHGRPAAACAMRTVRARALDAEDPALHDPNSLVTTPRPVLSKVAMM